MHQEDCSFEYRREFLTDLQQAFELAADEAQGISDYLVAIQDCADPKLKKILQGILAQEREHLRLLTEYANGRFQENPRAV